MHTVGNVANVAPECHQSEMEAHLWGCGNYPRVDSRRRGLLSWKVGERLIHRADIRADAFLADCAHSMKITKCAHVT